MSAKESLAVESTIEDGRSLRVLRVGWYVVVVAASLLELQQLVQMCHVEEEDQN